MVLTKVVLPEKENPALPETVVPVLKLHYQRRKIQSAAGDGRSSTKTFYYQRRKLQPPAGDRCSSIKVLLSEKENPAVCRRRSFQY